MVGKANQNPQYIGHFVGPLLPLVAQEVLEDVLAQRLGAPLDEIPPTRPMPVLPLAPTPAEGDSVAEVLSYVQYSKDDLITRVRRALEAALRDKRLTPAESGRFMRRYEEALEGYTYLNISD